MISFGAVVYFLCFLSSALCAALLCRAFRQRKERLLLWSSLCFGLLALNNLLVFVDIIVLPDMNLVPFRSATALAAMAILLYGFIWEIEQRKHQVMMFIYGMVTMGYMVAGLFFLKFWARSGDVLFFIFSLAFWLLAATQLLLAALDLPREEQGWVYMLRFSAFALIVVAIIYKNVSRRFNP